LKGEGTRSLRNTKAADLGALRGTGWSWFVVVAIAALFRLFGLLDQIPRGDEWHALARVTSDGFRGIASSFGAVDHSIPWTLWLEAVDRLRGIDEATFYLPGALTALGLVLAVPLAARERLGERAAWLWALLLAVSPVLIEYARIARPYGWAALAAPLALVLWLRYRETGDRRAATGWVVATVAVGWALPPHLPFCLAPLLLPESLAALGRRGERRRVLVPALAAGAALGLLLLPALVADWGSLALRVAGAESYGRELFGRVPQELVGALSPWGALPIFGAAWLGLRSSRAFEAPNHALLRLLGFGGLLQLAAILVARPLATYAAPVFARYALPLAPAILLAAALGVERLFGSGRERPLDRPVVISLALAFALVASPLALLFRTPNGFGTWWVRGMAPPRAAFFDAGAERALAERWLTPFYRRLRADPPGSVVVVEAPYSGIYFTPYRHLQILHRQRVLGGLLPAECGDNAELGYGLARGTVRRFANLVEVLDRDAVARRGARWIVLHKSPRANERFSPPRGRPLRYDYDRCRARVEAAYGRPVFESERELAFAVGSGA